MRRINSGARSMRRMPRGPRVGAIGTALSRLEQEHVALLMALCELEDPAEKDATSPAMRAALYELLREDLRRTQHALSLAALGLYGTCESCGRPLSRRHLELKPSVTHCDVCVSRVRRGI